MNAPSTSRPVNGLGIAGFVVSLVGLCGTIGLLCPVGLVLSLVALGKPPRGMAIAGAIIGALGSCGAILAIFIVPALLVAILAAGAAVGVASIAGPDLEAKIEMLILSFNVEQHIETHQGAVPAALAEVTHGLKESQFTDPWGSVYGYEVTQQGRAFRLYSLGPDKTAGTADDIPFTWETKTNNQSHLDPTPPAAPASPDSGSSAEEPPAPPSPPS